MPSSDHPHPHLHRLAHRLTGDARRTITRFFWPGSEARARGLIDRANGLSDGDVTQLLQEAIEEFGDRHPDLREILAEHHEEAVARTHSSAPTWQDRQLLIGAYFTMEYAFESAALFNPSMVPARDQEGVKPGSTRFLMSLRAVGEGHISSIVFRTGVIDASGDISIDPPVPWSRRLSMVEDRDYDKNTFRIKLIEMGAYTETVGQVLEALPDCFTRLQLQAAIDDMAARSGQTPGFQETGQNMVWLAQSNYRIQAAPDADPSEIVIFPLSENESQGMEDNSSQRHAGDPLRDQRRGHGLRHRATG